MFLKAVSLVVPAQMLKLFIGLGIQIIIARLLLPEGRGIYAICIASSAMLLIFTNFGNEFGIRYLFVSNRITSALAFYYLMLTTIFSLSVAIAVGLFLTLFEIVPIINITWQQITLACMLSFSQLAATQINVLLTISGKFAQASVLAILEEFLKLVSVLILLPGNPTVETALISAVLANLAVILLGTLRFKLHVKDFDGLEVRDIFFIYSYGFRSVWLNLSNLSIAHIGTLILSGLMSYGQIGIYNLAFGLVARLQVLPDALNRALVPVARANADDEKNFRMVQISVTGLLAFSLLIVPVFGLFNEAIMTGLFGTEYAEAGPIALILLIGFSFKIIGKPLEAHFNEITGNPTVIAAVQIFSIVSMALLTYFGASRFGLVGAAAGSSAAIFLSFVSLLITYRLSTGREIHSLLNLRGLQQSWKAVTLRGKRR